MSGDVWRELRAEALAESWRLRVALGARLDGWEHLGPPSAGWHARAMCAGLTDLFYARRPDDIAAARDVCRSCPVRLMCLQEGFAVERTMPLFDVEWSGVLGGFAAADRLAWWKAHPELRDIRPAVAECGTDGGYHAHRRRRETPCDDCKAAHTAGESIRAHRERVRRRGHAVASQGVPAGRIRVQGAAAASSRRGRASA